MFVKVLLFRQWTFENRTSKGMTNRNPHLNRGWFRDDLIEMKLYFCCWFHALTCTCVHTASTHSYKINVTYLALFCMSLISIMGWHSRIRSKQLRANISVELESHLQRLQLITQSALRPPSGHIGPWRKDREAAQVEQQVQPCRHTHTPLWFILF